MDPNRNRRETMTDFDQWLLLMYNENCKERMYYNDTPYKSLWDYYEAQKEYLERRYYEEKVLTRKS